MTGFEDETYSTLFASLKHPIRRKILRILSSGPHSFSDLQKVFEIESSHLTYHLDGLGSLLLKTKDGKYALSSFGEAAVSVMTQVEETPRAVVRLRFPWGNWKALVVAVTVGVFLLSALFFFEYEQATQFSTRYANLSELLRNFFPDVLDLRDAGLTRKYTIDDTVETPYALNNETSAGSSFAFSSRYSRVYAVYNLLVNATLEIEIFLDGPTRLQDYLHLTTFRELITSNVAYVGSIVNTKEPLSFNASEAFVYLAFSYEPILNMKITDGGKYSVTLPSRGWYFIQIEAPIEDTEGLRQIGYTLTLRVKGQQDYIPFFVGSQQDYLLSYLDLAYPNGR